jgi:hypothetical protein
MMTIELFEGAGHAAALTMLGKLLNSKNQEEAVPAISDFLHNIGTATGEEELRYTCAGASGALVDVLLTGLSEIRNRSAR